MITQRESKDRYGVPIDVFESTYIKFFEKIGIQLRTISNFHNDVSNILRNEIYDLIILTGGGAIDSKYYDKPHFDELQENRDKVEKILIDHAIITKTPILAICRGMEYVNGIFGGKLSKLDQMNKKREIGNDHPIVIGNDIIYVNNYHKDGIYSYNLSKEFQIVALDIDNNVVESFYSKEKKILAVQWHPERNFSHIESNKLSEKLVTSFIINGGFLDEGYYFSGRTRN